jgi:hypothetical protein
VIPPNVVAGSFVNFENFTNGEFELQPKIRVLTYHHITNNGAFLFTYALMKKLQDEFPNSGVKILDYKTMRLALYEWIKRFKLLPGEPFFYNSRYRMWSNFIREKLKIDSDIPHFAGKKQVHKFFSDNFDLLIVGMDVWGINRGTERPSFPNIYWLPEKMDIPKVAYSVSGYFSDLSFIKFYSKKISKYLDDFEVIGARDRFTHDVVMKFRTRSDGLVERIPDPAFLYEIQNTNISAKLKSLGVDLDRPILGLLLFGNDELSREIKKKYHAKGYQIVALSMYNPNADFNLGHLLNPFEWAEAFGLFDFCITDRFHGIVFCLKNQTPFISVEKEKKLLKSQSKIYDLLSDLDLTNCYQNPNDDGFNTQMFFSQADEIIEAWDSSFEESIKQKVHALINQHRIFIAKMRAELKW